jgi:hypothetical protein
MTEEIGNYGTHGPRPAAGAFLSTSDRELIDRYLAGRLDEATRAEVEARIVGDAAFRAEVELTGELRAGLHELESRGDLGRLDAARRPVWQRPAYALAASVVAGLLGIAILAMYGQLEDARTELQNLRTAIVLRPASPDSRPRVATLVRARSGTPVDLVLVASELPDLVELRLDPGADGAPAYRVALDRLDAERVIAVLRLPSMAPGDDGTLVLVINAAFLAPGSYRVSLASAAPGSSEVVYRLRVDP